VRHGLRGHCIGFVGGGVLSRGRGRPRARAQIYSGAGRGFVRCPSGWSSAICAVVRLCQRVACAGALGGVHCTALRSGLRTALMPRRDMIVVVFDPDVVCLHAWLARIIKACLTSPVRGRRIGAVIYRCACLVRKYIWLFPWYGGADSDGWCDVSGFPVLWPLCDYGSSACCGNFV